MLYFETIPPLHRSLILVGGLSFFWVLEGFFSLFNFQYKKWSHALPNIFFTGTTILINFFRVTNYAYVKYSLLGDCLFMIHSSTQNNTKTYHGG